MVKIVSLCTLLITLSMLLAPATQAASTHRAPVAAGPPDPRFGVVESYDAPGAAFEMGAGWTRIPFLWARMQPNGAEEWVPPITDEALARERAQGRQPVGLIITTPNWATDVGIGPGVPYGLHTGHNDPNNLWANFLRKLVTAYTGRIDHWIIWNEPDVWDASHPGYTWGGSVEDFFQLQRVAYLAIKEANPNAKVILSGTSYWWDAAYGRDLYFRKYLDTLVQDMSAAGNGYYCDAVALHVYFQPDFVYSITALYHQLMREHGFDKPVWIVETNAAPSLDPHMPVPNGQFAITLDEQAAYIIQAFAMGIAGGASRIGIFKMIDTDSDLAANPEPFGLVRANGSRRPGFNTYRVATTYMAGFQGGQLEQRPDVSIVTIPRSSGTTTVLWSRTPSPATAQIPARAASATLVDMWGSRRTISSSDGVYSLSLPGASCTHGPPCIIGGPPYLIVEGSVDAAPPPAQPPTVSGDTNATENQSSTEDRATDPPMLIPRPEYTVNLQQIKIKGAQDVWRKRALQGYQIELITGPPFHLYLLTVIDKAVKTAQRSLEPLSIDLDDLDARKRNTALTSAMTTLYNKHTLYPFTVAGLFDQVAHFYEDHPTDPACDTEVSIQLNGDYAFPSRIAEQWVDSCQVDRDPPWLAVVGFATLTPTPTKVPTHTAEPSPTTSPTPSATPHPTASATSTPSSTPLVSATPQVSATPPVSPAQSSDNFPLWLILPASIIAAGAVLFIWTEKAAKRKRKS